MLAHLPLFGTCECMRMLSLLSMCLCWQAVVDQQELNMLQDVLLTLSSCLQSSSKGVSFAHRIDCQNQKCASDGMPKRKHTTRSTGKHHAYCLRSQHEHCTVDHLRQLTHTSMSAYITSSCGARWRQPALRLLSGAYLFSL